MHGTGSAFSWLDLPSTRLAKKCQGERVRGADRSASPPATKHMARPLWSELASPCRAGLTSRLTVLLGPQLAFWRSSLRQRDEAEQNYPIGDG
jgi:hypothetical protein